MHSEDEPHKVFKDETGASYRADRECASASQLFEGKLVYETRCFECDTFTRKAEDFLHVSVPVTCQGLPGFGGVFHTPSQECSTSAVAVSLSWALSMFASQERLCGKNKYWCGRCGHLEEAERNIRFSALPQILIVHLNRFTTHCWGGRVGKVSGNIAVPLTLCLRPWCTDDCTYRDVTYKLQAAVLHSGSSCNSGHYTALVRNAHQWLHFDDENIQELSENEIKLILSPLYISAACVYIVFYCIK